MLDQALLLVTQTILISVPFVLAALGGSCSERGGVVNIALEGILLGGAFATALAAFASGSPWVGLFAGLGAGIAIAGVHAVLTVAVKIDQIIAGLAINMLVGGVTEYGMHLVWRESAARAIPVLPRWSLGFGGAFGDLADTLAGMPLVIVTIFALPIIHLLLERTVFGLRLRASGESPAAVDTAGISVWRMRTLGVLISGGLAGLGGAWLAFNIGQFQHGMSAGKGFIAMAAVVCGRWRPVGATLACLLFGASGALSAGFERWGLSVPSELISTLPYVLTIVAVTGLVGRARAPAALGQPYEK